MAYFGSEKRCSGDGPRNDRNPTLGDSRRSAFLHTEESIASFFAGRREGLIFLPITVPKNE